MRRILLATMGLIVLGLLVASPGQRITGMVVQEPINPVMAPILVLGLIAMVGLLIIKIVKP